MRVLKLLLLFFELLLLLPMYPSSRHFYFYELLWCDAVFSLKLQCFRQ